MFCLNAGAILQIAITQGSICTEGISVVQWMLIDVVKSQISFAKKHKNVGDLSYMTAIKGERKGNKGWEF